MKFKFALLVAVLIAMRFSVAAQTNPVAAVTPANSVLIPEPRKGRGAVRQTAVLQTARDNQGSCDVELIGDSITEGWEKSGQKAWQEYYGQLKVLNFGVNGDRIQNVLWRFGNGQLDGIKPKVAIVMIGTNNSNGQDNSEADILEGVKAIVSGIRERQPGTKILVLGILPRGVTFCPERNKIVQVNQALTRLDDGKNTFYLDLGSQFIGNDGSLAKDLLPDTIHPNAAGYEIWAKAMEPKLKKMLAE